MSIGGVLLDPVRREIQYFGAKLSRAAAAVLLQSSANPIAVVELLAVLVSMALWAARFEGQLCLGFVDNEAAKHALARGLSSVADIAGVLEGIMSLEIEGRLLAYFERVPTSSNIADAPSRGAPCSGVPGWPAPAEVAMEVLPAWLQRAPVRPRSIAAEELAPFLRRVFLSAQTRQVMLGIRAVSCRSC